ncbi:MAG: universal stress protein [Robiginitalea sp.]|jgi:nucleotide-binding universal stress UspA family protein
MGLRIAIPTDFSENAYKAAYFALELFKGQECVFYLTHTYTPAFYRAEYLLHSPGQIGLGDFYQERVKKKLRKFEKQLILKASDSHKFFCHAAFNSLAEELNQMGRKETLDLIVMGTQGATGAKEVLFGTHAVQVLHKASCPVLVVPEDAEVDDLTNILFPTDFTPNYAKLQLKVLLGILKRPGVNLHVLHAYAEADSRPRRQQARKQLEDMLGSYNARITETGEADILRAINQYARTIPVQLLVMVRNEHTFLENLLVTPVIDLIGFHSKIPFMVLPSPGEG